MEKTLDLKRLWFHKETILCVFFYKLSYGGHFQCCGSGLGRRDLDDFDLDGAFDYACRFGL